MAASYFLKILLHSVQYSLLLIIKNWGKFIAYISTMTQFPKLLYGVRTNSQLWFTHSDTCALCIHITFISHQPLIEMLHTAGIQLGLCESLLDRKMAARPQRPTSVRPIRIAFSWCSFAMIYSCKLKLTDRQKSLLTG